MSGYMRPGPEPIKHTLTLVCTLEVALSTHAHRRTRTPDTAPSLAYEVTCLLLCRTIHNI